MILPSVQLDDSTLSTTFFPPFSLHTARDHDIVLQHNEICIYYTGKPAGYDNEIQIHYFFNAFEYARAVYLIAPVNCVGSIEQHHRLTVLAY